MTKCGNPRLRWALAEMAWRLLRFQPEYRLTPEMAPRITDPHATPGRKKQLWWRWPGALGWTGGGICTGQTTPEKLGLMMANENQNDATPNGTDFRSGAALGCGLGRCTSFRWLE